MSGHIQSSERPQPLRLTPHFTSLLGCPHQSLWTRLLHHAVSSWIDKHLLPYYLDTTLSTSAACSQLPHLGPLPDHESIPVSRQSQSALLHRSSLNMPGHTHTQHRRRPFVIKVVSPNLQCAEKLYWFDFMILPSAKRVF